MIFFLNKQERRVVPQDFKINTKINHLKNDWKLRECELFCGRASSLNASGDMADRQQTTVPKQLQSDRANKK